MFIIVGLGNPGKDYTNTRHNIGFDVIDALADAAGISVIEKKHKAIIGKGVLDGQKVILAKPQTYMNLSGESVREIIDYYKVDEEQELIVISDDISLDVGNIRVRKKGSAGGHNGLKNIIAHLGHDTFMRVKMGVGEKPKGYDLADYVLGHFTADERKVMNDAAKSAVEAIRMMMAGDVDKAMNEFNKKSTQQS
ncbi:MAG: aminoacyl-tRNA hydrolase [Lachnospiraceae bacterium]|nr:aminoacyl-tRNA hydrolase [Lachnospiraceae bacterium]